MGIAAEATDEELVALFPGRQLDQDNQAFFRGWLRRQLLMNRCAECRLWHQPPRPLCPRCWSWDVRPEAVAGAGTIHLVVLLHQGPPGVDYSSPYPVVTVELDEQPGLRLTSTVVGAPNDDIAIGRRVELVWIERGGAPMPAFRLQEAGR